MPMEFQFCALTVPQPCPNLAPSMSQPYPNYASVNCQITETNTFYNAGLANFWGILQIAQIRGLFGHFGPFINSLSGTSQQLELFVSNVYYASFHIIIFTYLMRCGKVSHLISFE